MPEPNTEIPSHPIVDGINAFMKGLPWGKITAPMVTAIGGLWYVGSWLKDLYSINVQNKVVDAFPTAAALWTYLVGGLLLIAVYLGLSAWHMKKNMKNIK